LTKIAVESVCPNRNFSFKLLFLLVPSFVWFFLSPAPTFSQGIKFDHLSVKQGLSQGNVLDIQQDKFGFIWIGTEDGLNMFDGYTFTIFRNNPKDSTSLSNNNIYCLVEDKDGNLWIGTQNGLNYYDRRSNIFQRYFNKTDDKSSLTNNTILSLCIDSKNNLWIGTANGLSFYDIAKKQFTQYVHVDSDSTSLANADVRSVIEDHAKRIWAGTSGGLGMLNADQKTFTNYVHDPNNGSSISSNKIRTLFEDKDHSIWVGTFDQGLNKFDEGKKMFMRFMHNSEEGSTLPSQFIHEMDQNSVGEFWVATDGGLSLYNPVNRTFTSHKSDSENESSLSSNIITNIFFDLNDRLWVGTRFGGVNVYDKDKYAFWHFKHKVNDPSSMSGNTVNSFAEDEIGNIWIGIDGAGLNYYDRKKNQFIRYFHDPANVNSISSNKVLSVKLDRLGGLWIGHWGGGLDYFDRKTKKFKHYKHDEANPNSIGDNNVFHILEDSKGNLWFATFGKGISKYNRDTDDFRIYAHDPNNTNSLSGNTVIYLLEDHLGKIWIATRQDGLDMFDPETETFTHYKFEGKPGDLSDNAVFDLFEDSKTRLWVGTNGGGLNLFDHETKTFKVYRQSDGLPNDVIMGLLEDDHHNLWISTNKGLSKFNADSVTFKNYDEGDGLQGNQFNRWSFKRLATGELLFGGVNGFNLFDPNKIRDNAYKPPVYITDFKLFNKAVNIGKDEILKSNILFTKEIDMPYSQNFFSFEFTALNYRQTEKNRYKYIMEGFQDEWIDAGTERKVSYTNLSPGDYVFRVIASNNDGVWNNEGASIKIHIIPPFWRTAWFITLVIVTITSSVVGYIRYQKKKAKRQEEELKAVIETRTGEVQKQSEAILKKNEQEKFQNWITQGLATFGDIISKHKGSLDELSREILRNLVTYVQASQGTISIANKEDEADEHLMVLSTYGVNQERLKIKRIEVGDGLIGSTYKDKEKKIMTNLPDSYIQVASGLGKTVPITLVLLPLKTDDGEIQGVIELAFLNDVSDVVQSFLDKVASVIALNVHAANLNYKTTRLLQQSKEQTEELQAQEEEMRQNMEELEATQEELKRREKEYQDKIRDLELSLKKCKDKMDAGKDDANL
jgi:ligand-binding sensor domain-containing protein